MVLRRLLPVFFFCLLSALWFYPWENFAISTEDEPLEEVVLQQEICVDTIELNTLAYTEKQSAPASRPRIEPISLPKSGPVGSSLLVDPIIKDALALKGIPYKFGGSSLKAFDCSGYVQFVFQKHDIDLPHASYAMARMGRPVDQKALKKGDLLFFTGTSRHTNGISHVGLVTEVADGSIQFAHATRRGVVIDDLINMDYYQHHYAMARRVLE